MARFLVPILRAGAQALVAFIVAFIAVKLGLHVSPDTQELVIGALTTALTGLVARGQQVVEKRYPRVGKLLHTPWYQADIQHQLDKAREEIARKIVDSANKALTPAAIDAADTTVIPAVVPPAPEGVPAPPEAPAA